MVGVFLLTISEKTGELNSATARGKINMMLGNLSVDDMEKEMGISFPEPFRAEFAAKRQEQAENISPGKWHCFRFPFFLACGNSDLLEEVKTNLMPLSAEVKTDLQVAVVSK